MQHPHQPARNVRSSEQGVPFSDFARVIAAISIALLAAVLIAISAFRSKEEMTLNTVVTPAVGTKPEVNPFRP